MTVMDRSLGKQRSWDPPDARHLLPLIRANHRYAFRSGEWARIVGVSVQYPAIGVVPRICFDVEFLDGATDQWPVEDQGYQYEFRPSLMENPK